jgi:hypothetical protein
MKKTLLFLVASMVGIGAQAQYQQFENWTNNSVLNLDDHETTVSDNGAEGALACFRSTDANSGTYSIRLETVLSPMVGDTVFGYFISGDPDTQSPGQSTTPFNGVDSIVGYYKYDIQAGDSCLLLVATTFMGTTTGGGTYYIPTGTQSTWKRFSYPIMSVASDSLLFGAATGDPLNNFDGIPGTWIQFDDVQLKKGAQTQSVVNGGFENWSPIMWEDPTGWNTANQWAFGEPTLPVVKTTDSYTGTYAIQLSTLASTNFPGDTLFGGATNGYFDNNGPQGGAPYTSTPTGVECYYKYAPVNSDMANIGIEFFKNGSSVGTAGNGFNTTVSTYTLWNQAISLSQAPDTVLITLWAGNEIGSVFKVDDIDFVFPLGVSEDLIVDQLVSYPNPATDVIKIRFDLKKDSKVAIRLINAVGQELTARSLGQLSSGTYRESFNTSDFAYGIYFIEFTLNGEKVTQQFIIQ